MKKIAVLLAGFAIPLFLSCKKEEPETPKVIYETTAKSKAANKIDTTQIQIADLPIHIQGTNFMVHPVGDFRVYERKIRSGYGYEKGSFSISNYSEFEITGFLQNLKFQEMNSDSLIALTDKPVLIQTATFLKILAATKKQIVVYNMSDMDTNKDGRIDANDIRSLYISEIGGAKLTKISPELEELVDWNLVEAKNRLYFRTIEDTNKNGEFDKNDVLHYSYIDLSDKDWKVINYNPI